MNILLLNYEYPPLGGGAGIVTQHLASCFINAHHEVTVVTTWFSGEPEFFSENRLTIIRLKAKRKVSFQSNPYEMYDWMMKAKEYCLSHFSSTDFQICLANFSLPGGYVANALNQKWKLPYVILSHGHDIPWFSPKQMFFWHLLLYFPIKKLLKHAAKIVVLTNQLKPAASKIIGSQHENKIEVIPNGILPLQTRKSFNKEDAILKSVFVGRLVQQKDPLTVLKAHAVLLQQQIPVHLTFIGDGELKSNLEAYIKKHKITNVEFVGKVSQSQVLEILSKSHVLIAPSKEEAMSMAVLEAISSGLYVFATSLSGNKELIDDGVNGNFVEYGNVNQIAHKISDFYFQKFLQNYSYPTTQLGHTFQENTWEHIAQRYIQLFTEILKDN